MGGNSSSSSKSDCSGGGGRDAPKRSGGGDAAPRGSSSSSSKATDSGGSSAVPSKIRGKTNSRGDEIIFGGGVHVGREGNVDLTGRRMDFLGTSIVNMITEDELHRTATSLTLTDNILYTLGKEMTLLPDLKEIDMDRNRFTRLPEMLTQLPELWRINISCNPIDPIRGFDTAPRLHALRVIVIRECNLATFPPRILEAPALEELDVSDNPSIDFHDAGIGSFARIKTLNVANCGLNGRMLPICIRRASGLLSLDISGNHYELLGEVSSEFFGKSIPKTLRELSVRGMGLISVPPFVANLRKLHSLDLAMNPIETLDVLAGRVVRRIPRTWSTGTLQSGAAAAMSPSNNASAGTGAPPGKDDPLMPRRSTLRPNSAGDNNDDDGASSDGRASNSSRMSMSKLSKAGMIAPVSQPIPLKKLSLRACGLRTVPKYFHKLTGLEELDLSENDQLDDSNMTLFSLQNLKVLNLVGCPFAEDPSKSRNEWFDIAKLRKLADIQWEVWKGNHNMSPYRTRIPIEICGLRLRKINLVQLRKDLFVGNTIETVVNLLRDGYFKVDLAVDDNTLYGHVEAIVVFAHGESFFFPEDVTMAVPAGPKKLAAAAAAVGGSTPVAAAAAAAPSPKSNPAQTLIQGRELGIAHLHISVNRYIFFLAMQAANYDAVIIPPLDVMIIHYSQITCNPVKYRADCEAICGRILNCNYRAFFLEQRRHPQAAKDAVAASKKVWNLMVRSAQTELKWLRYDFWERRARTIDTQNKTAETEQQLHNLPSGPCGITDSERFADYGELHGIDSTSDLCGVLDQAITAHFLEQGDFAFHKTLVRFFEYNNSFQLHRDALSRLTLDWVRYVKYLALYSYRVALRFQSDSTVVMEPMADGDGNLYTPGGAGKRVTSFLGPRYDTLHNSSFADPARYLPGPNQPPAAGCSNDDGEPPERRASGFVKRTTSMLSTASSHGGANTRRRETQRRARIKALKVDPIPTIGISLLLHAHRTTHVKYFQTLSLLGIEHVDVEWEETPESIAQTKDAWEALYEESYIGASPGYTFHALNGVISPMQPKANGQASSKVYLPPSSPTGALDTGALYSPTMVPLKSSFRAKGSNNNNSAGLERSVTLCCGDTEYGVF